MGLASLIALGAALVPLATFLIFFEIVQPHWLVREFAWFAALPVFLFAFAYTFDKLSRPTIRRCVRAVLGSHCSTCDYDLRATPDPPYPGVAHCPECGKQIPRNVHRRTISAPRGARQGAARLDEPSTGRGP